MFPKIPNASVAVFASDDDVLLFFECVLESELKLSLFVENQIQRILKGPRKFDVAFFDFLSALKQKRLSRWNEICDFFDGNVFVLAWSEEVFDLQEAFSSDVNIMPYPFTKELFYGVFRSLMPKFFERSSCSAGLKINSDAFKLVPQFSRLVGGCEKINDIKRKILMVAETDTPLIFFGESGTGKTMAAQIAHELSPRKNKPFVIANMANGNKELFESVLFGSVRGAFTDARDRSGLFKKADTGTLFMDEIAELSLDCQAKLLRVIETGIFRPVGSDEECKCDARLIFATNADLEKMVRQKLFREDLYWRIVDFPIEVPSLRERLDDFPLLVEHELNEIQKKTARPYSITKEAVDKMLLCDWPGNFRQFKACLRRAAILCRDSGVIDHDAISF